MSQIIIMLSKVFIVGIVILFALGYLFSNMALFLGGCAFVLFGLTWVFYLYRIVMELLAKKED